MIHIMWRAPPFKGLRQCCTRDPRTGGVQVGEFSETSETLTLKNTMAHESVRRPHPPPRPWALAVGPRHEKGVLPHYTKTPQR
jgi:hypothetical protein